MVRVVVVRRLFSGPADSERMVTARPTTRDYTVPPDISIQRQRFLATGFKFRVRLGSGLPVLHNDSSVVLILQKRGRNGEMYGFVEIGKLWGRRVFVFSVIEPCYLVDWCGP